MRCVITMPGISGGSPIKTRLIASVPPVEAPIAIRRSVVRRCLSGLPLARIAAAPYFGATPLATPAATVPPLYGRTLARAAMRTFAQSSSL
jgi:hypothetical protein